MNMRSRTHLYIQESLLASDSCFHDWGVTAIVTEARTKYKGKG